jgi:two-component system sensor histidine kinase BarA
MFATEQSAATIGRARTLRGKLGFLVICSVGLAVVPIALISAWQDAKRDGLLRSARLEASAQILASTVSEATARHDPQHAFQSLRAIGQMAGVSYARIEAPLGRLLVEAGAGARLSSDAMLTTGGERPVWTQLFSGTTQIEAPIVHDRRTVGRLVVLGSTDGAFGTFMRSLLQSLGIALAAILLGLLIARKMQSGIVGPLLALIGSMRDIQSSHQYDKPVGLKADDEVADLISSFNGMIHQINIRDQRISAQLASLEDEVRARTSDLETAKNTAEDATRAKSEFLAAMSHEIRTPMNGIMVMAEMLADSSLPPRQQRFADVIANAGASLLSIINDILDFSKSESGKLELEELPVDVGAAVEDVLSLFWERAREKGLALGSYISPAVPHMILTDPVRLRQILSNLVNNALKFTERGGVTIEVESGPGSLTLAVRDTGIGIPPDKIGSLFEAFTQADQSTTRKFGGTGLGLAICRKLVHAMGGGINVSSVLGQGSVFQITMPVKEAEPALAWPMKGDRYSSAAVMLEPFLRDLVIRYVNASGYRIVTASDADVIIAHPEFFQGRDGLGGKIRLCVSDFSDAAAQNLVSSGKVDRVLYQPMRRSELRDTLELIAVGADLAVKDRPRAAVELASFEGLRVLVADDSPVNLEVAREALSRLNIETHCVMDGRAAVEAAMEQHDKVDLILMDGSMPEMDGFAASREIRKLERERGLSPMPIIALTAHVVGAAAEAWRSAEMNGVLHKPFTLKSLTTTLSGALIGKSLKSDAAAPGNDVEGAGGDLAPVLFDEAVLAELAGMSGQSDFVQKLAQLYADNAPNSLAALRMAQSEASSAEAALAAHALKSMSLNIGAVSVSRLAAQIEAEGRDGTICTEQSIQMLADAVTASLAWLRKEGLLRPLEVRTLLHG